jgi:hypothetical protein
MAYLGQLPGPVCGISGCMGRVWTMLPEAESGGTAVEVGVWAAAGFRNGVWSTLKFARQPAEQEKDVVF